MMPCAGLLLTIFIGFSNSCNSNSLQQLQHLLEKCEDNSEQMPKEEVDALKRPSHGLTKKYLTKQTLLSPDLLSAPGLVGIASFFFLQYETLKLIMFYNQTDRTQEFSIIPRNTLADL